MDVANHISQNFVLYGLGSEEAAIVQTVRELVENSKDAIMANTITDLRITKREIRISISNDSACVDEVVVTVTDDGIGMEDASNCLRCFSSQRIDANDPQLLMSTTGKYGIGLSACMLYSQLMLGRESTTKIKSKIAANDLLRVTNFKFNLSTGQPLAVYEELSNPSLSSGTEVVIILPKRISTRSLKIIVNNLKMYFERIQMLPTNIISTILSVSVLSSDTSENIRSEQKCTCTQRGQFPSIDDELDYRNAYTEHLMRTFSQFQEEDESCDFCTMSFSHTPIEEKSPNRILTQELTISLILVTSRDRRGDKKFFSDSDIPIQILRYVNGSPIVDSSDAFSCALFRAVSGFRWRNYGYKFRIELPTTGGQTQKDKTFLQMLEDSTLPNKTDKITPSTLIVFIDFKSPSVSYSNLLKTSVALDNDFSYRLDRHLKSAMDDLKLITHDLFMSLQEMSEHLLWNVGIQLMSTGLIGIAECDPDPTIMNQLAEMFGINYNEMDPNILKFEVGEHLLVQQMLRDAIIHEGQCSSITSGMVRDQKHIDREVECLGSEIISTNEDRLNLIPKKRNFYTLNQNNLIDSLQADIYGFKCCVQDNDTNDDEFQGVELFDLFQDTEIHSSK